MDQDDDDIPAKPRRTPGPDVKHRRDAVAVVQPLNLKIGEWQESVAKLASGGQWQRMHGRLDGDFAVQLQELRRTIETGRGQFIKDLERLPPEIQQHGRIEDTLKALQTVMAGLERAERLTRD